MAEGGLFRYGARRPIRLLACLRICQRGRADQDGEVGTSAIEGHHFPARGIPRAGAPLRNLVQGGVTVPHDRDQRVRRPFLPQGDGGSPRLPLRRG